MAFKDSKIKDTHDITWDKSCGQVRAQYDPLDITFGVQAADGHTVWMSPQQLFDTKRLIDDALESGVLGRAQSILDKVGVHADPS